ncbi:hypothetical protein WwAna0851 [Wolbachia endosymbiont of Drosophila ananassae]|nr:hypothetical protein WwAna0116 [Wolbachia endosymbiont of Drosophila ananassae]EAL58090.1 hypothetical protein WwAna0092 [Wolbachia endosymbiont of Drosophila ananassae]EAL58433.1 hypothetical protein WwAna0851 [Wolbachia endosymbiont of Drosophila ananassae]
MIAKEPAKQAEIQLSKLPDGWGCQIVCLNSFKGL